MRRTASKTNRIYPFWVLVCLVVGLPDTAHAGFMAAAAGQNVTAVQGVGTNNLGVTGNFPAANATMNITFTTDNANPQMDSLSYNFTNNTGQTMDDVRFTLSTGGNVVSTVDINLLIPPANGQPAGVIYRPTLMPNTAYSLTALPTFNVATVPEPSSLVMLAIGTLAVGLSAGYRRIRHRPSSAQTRDGD